MGTKTIMYDRIVPPGGEFRPRTRVRVRLVAADSGEGTGYNSTDRRTIVGVADELLSSELFVIDLDSTASISAPAGNAYEITRIYPKHPAPPAATFTAPTEPAPTSTTQAVTLPATNIAASTTGFASSGAIYLAGQLVTYTGTTPTAFTGCTGGTGLIASGTAVRQAHWIPDHLVNPPVGLPALHIVDPIDAHDASAISVIPAGSLLASNVQSALAELASEADAGAAGLAAHLADPSDAHDASSVSIAAGLSLVGSDVQTILGQPLGTAIGSVSVAGPNPVVSFRSVWGLTLAGVAYFDPAGAATDEDAVLVATTDGHFALVRPE